MISYLGQLIIGLAFVLASGLDLKGRAKLVQLVVNKKLPYPEYLTYGAIGLKFVGGLGLILNIIAPFCAFLLAGFVIIANVIFNDFWKREGDEREKVFLKFLTYCAVIGGLVYIFGQI